MTNRLTFLSHFIICLACAALAFFAWQTGAVLMVWQTDASMMTSVIVCLFVSTAVWLGWQAWGADDAVWDGRGFQITSTSGGGTFECGDRVEISGMRTRPVSSDFGHLAALLSPALGMLGTAIGLSLQAKSLVNGAASFGALSTSLFTTACGIAGFILISVMVFNLECGIARARR